jgi:ABC-type Mn2+/Zn2+ transport system ATPase subunit
MLSLDEPTAGLDPGTAQRIRQVIRDARDTGATVFLTTHDDDPRRQRMNITGVGRSATPAQETSGNEAARK